MTSDRLSNKRPTAKRTYGLRAVLRWIARLLLPLAVIAATGFVFKALVASKPEVKKRPAREVAYAVQTRPVKPASIQPHITLFGTVSAARSVDLRALVGGEVIWVNPGLAEGQVLEEGEALVRIDAFDYEGAVREAKANLAEATAKMTETRATIASETSAIARLKEQAELAERDLERARKLVKSGSLTVQSLESRTLVLSQREQAVEARSNNLTVLKAKVEQLKANSERLQWRLDQAERNLVNTNLKAPFTGLVQKKNVDLGRNVSGNDSLVTMYDPGQMDVRFTLSDAQYGRLISGGKDLVGSPITVNWRLGDDIQTHRATIERITPEIDATNGGIEVFARLSKEAGLRSGTFVELSVPDKTYTGVIRVPQAAIYDDNRLYIADADSRMVSHKVEIKAYLGDDVLVDASPLDEGALVITTRIAEAGDGLKVILPGQSQKRAGQQQGKQKGNQQGEETGKQVGSKAGAQAKTGGAKQ
ncbi:MAG: efflux RND transporter periplasmic adaptor subunit [Cohaesibacter sp.]|jgi:RND family efflux transporter MFP subunit|nr:efflux RND transporter periplasmic adaptor subunit [Cohaesibacter sp.]